MAIAQKLIAIFALAAVLVGCAAMAELSNAAPPEEVVGAQIGEDRAV